MKGGFLLPGLSCAWLLTLLCKVWDWVKTDFRLVDLNSIFKLCKKCWSSTLVLSFVDRLAKNLYPFSKWFQFWILFACCCSIILYPLVSNWGGCSCFPLPYSCLLWALLVLPWLLILMNLFWSNLLCISQCRSQPFLSLFRERWLDLNRLLWLILKLTPTPKCNLLPAFNL